MADLAGLPFFGSKFWDEGMSIGEGTGVDFSTMRGRDYPTIRQFTVFLENRVGQLLEVVRRFEGSKVRIVTPFRSTTPRNVRLSDCWSATQSRAAKSWNAPVWR